MFRFLAPLILVALPCSVTYAQEIAIKLAESFDPANPYRVELKTVLSGKLAVPASGIRPASVIAVNGSSTITYDERPLPSDEAKTLKAIRIYRDVEFQRKLGERDQKASIRTDVRRLVVLRSSQGKKAPFSPDGPLTWNEIDIVRTDFFSMALVPGILPKNLVKPGDKWTVAAAGLTELSDLDPIEEGQLTVEFLSIVAVNQKKLAKLGINGTIKGANEDGPNRQKLDGIAYFDLDASQLSYLKLNGIHELLTPEGKVSGRLEGTILLTRQPSKKFIELTDQSLRGISLKPNSENSLLLYDNEELGVRFLYPRRWRVGVVQGKQIALEEPQGGGILITLEATASTPSVIQYQTEVVKYLKTQKANILKLGEARRIAENPCRIEGFAMEAELASGKVHMEYAVVSNTNGGATIAARLPLADAKNLVPDVARILKDFAITHKIDKK